MPHPKKERESEKEIKRGGGDPIFPITAAAFPCCTATNKRCCRLEGSCIIYGQAPQSCHVRARLEPGLIVQSRSTLIKMATRAETLTSETILRPGSKTLVLVLELGLAFHSGCWFKGYSHGGAPRPKITVEKGAYCSSVSVGLPARFWPRRQETELCEIKAQP